MFDEILVNKFFRLGIPKLMYDFDPWDLEAFIRGTEGKPLWILLIHEDLREILKVYERNWKNVINTYFTWQKDLYKDPVDQCYAIADKAVEIHTALFEGIDIQNSLYEKMENGSKNFNRDFFNLSYATAKFVDALCERIMEWALTHKFVGEVMEDAYEVE